MYIPSLNTFQMNKCPQQHFQRPMLKLFSGKEWDSLFLNLDNILIVSASSKDHVREMRHVLEKLRETVCI